MTPQTIQFKNLSSGKEEIFKAPSNRIEFQHFDISPDFRTLLLSVDFKTKTSECAYNHERQLFLINIDGTGLRRILIPE